MIWLKIDHQMVVDCGYLCEFGGLCVGCVCGWCLFVTILGGNSIGVVDWGRWGVENKHGDDDDDVVVNK
jgi:hypothetical protein